MALISWRSDGLIIMMIVNEIIVFIGLILSVHYNGCCDTEDTALNMKIKLSMNIKAQL